MIWSLRGAVITAFVMAVAIGAMRCAEAVTHYVTQASNCTFNGDGTTAACAASNLAPGARRDINTGLAALSAGDTLCVISDIANVARIILVSNGTAGNPVKLTSDCNGNTTRKILRTQANDVVLEGLNDSNIWIDFLTVEGSHVGQTQAIKFYATTANQSGIKLTRLIVTNSVATSATPNHGIWFTASGGFTFSDVILDQIVAHSNGIANTQNSDGINIEEVTSGLALTNIEAYGNESSGIDISGAGTNPVLRRAYLHDNGFSGAKFHCGTGPGSGANVSGVISVRNGGWGFVFQDIPSSKITNSVFHVTAAANVDPEQAPFGAMQLEAVDANNGNCPNASFTGNTFTNLDLKADYANGVTRIYDGTRAAFEAGNTWNGNNQTQSGVQTTVMYWNADTGNNITSSNWAANWQAGHALDKLAAVTQFAGGANPADLAGFRPLAASALCNAGALGTAGTDYFGKRFGPDPSIGAAMCN